MRIQSIAVFCGSQSGRNGFFENHAKILGEILARQQVKLVYGGGNVGLMGVVANSVLKGRGEVVGVIPHILDKPERAHHGLTELIVVEDMHTRKRKMYELCDAAIILPGGYGTLDEFFELVTWNNLSIHDKHIFILNSDGFYDHLLAHIETMYQQTFLYENPFQRLTILSQPEGLLPYLR